MKKDVVHRLDVVAVVLFCVIVVLIGRLAYLQLYEGQHYAKLSDGNRIRIIPQIAARGIIYDRNGAELVTNRPGFAASFVTLDKKVDPEVIARLSAIIGVPVEEINKKIANRVSEFEPVRLKVDIGQEIMTVIEEHRKELPGVIVEVQPVRDYIHKEMASHVLGYVSEISDAELASKKKEGYKSGDVVGKDGIEQVFDTDLRGKDGGEQVEVDVTGRPVATLGKKEAVYGNNLLLTLDKRIQVAAEQVLDEQLFKTGAKAAAVVGINPQNGEVLVLASRPSFNPNLFARGISEKNWQALNDNPFTPMNNRAISGEYPPGSTFKIITGVAALELGKVTPSEKIFDSGHHWIIDKGNAGGEALGWINFKEALSMSDNVYFYEMGNRLGIDNIEKYARLFGLGARTGIQLNGEAKGLVANKKYKELNYNEEWYLSETFDAAIGQGFQLATPIQMAVVMAEVANGGHRYKPTLVKAIMDHDGNILKSFEREEIGKLEVSDATWQLVRQALKEVAMTGGTAESVFRGFPISIAGKTGTAENPHGKDHSWFVAYAPFDNPQIALAVIVEQGGFGSTAAAPIVRRILEATFNINQMPNEKMKMLHPYSIF